MFQKHKLIYNTCCPYCRWSKSFILTDVKDEKEEIKFTMLTHTKYQRTYKKYRVKICQQCNSWINFKEKFYHILFIVGLFSLILSLLLFFVQSVRIIFLGLFSLCVLLGLLFWILWEIIGPTRSHVSYERATKYNALI